MAIPGDDSVTRWIGAIKAGEAPEAADDDAAAIWDRYFNVLAWLARKRLANRDGAAEDEEDAALSAFQSFHAGLARGRLRSSKAVTISGSCSW